MNMPSVMPSIEKPSSFRKITDNAGGKTGLNSVEDNGLFSALLLMLSVAGNNQEIQQATDSASSSSKPGSAINIHMPQLSQIESAASGKYIHSPKYEREAGSDKNDNATGITDSNRIDVHMLRPADSETYGGMYNSDLLKKDPGNHVENSSGGNPDIRPEIVSNIFNDPVSTCSETGIQQTHSFMDRANIVSQLSDKLVDLYHIGGNTAKIRLQPEELGHLHIDITVADDSIKAVVTVEDGSVKNILESNLDILIEDLKNAGLNIEQFTVNISSSSDFGLDLTGGWSDWNGNAMFNENRLPPVSVIEDRAVYDSNDMFAYSDSRGISIFV